MDADVVQRAARIAMRDARLPWWRCLELAVDEPRGRW